MGRPCGSRREMAILRTPALSQALSCRRRAGEACVLASKASWLMRSKHFAISTLSTYWGRKVIRWKMASMASQHERRGESHRYAPRALLPIRVLGLGARLSAVPGRVEWECPAGVFATAPFRYPRASQWRCLAIKTEGIGELPSLHWGEDFTPSMPAVCFPRLSWVTRRTAATVHTMTLSAVSATCVPS